MYLFYALLRSLPPCLPFPSSGVFALFGMIIYHSIQRLQKDWPIYEMGAEQVKREGESEGGIEGGREGRREGGRIAGG